MRVAVISLLMLALLAGCQTARGVRQTPPPPPVTPMGTPPPTSSNDKLQIPDVVTPPGIGTPTPVPAAPGTIAAPTAPVDAAQLASYPQSAESVSGAAVLSLLRKASEARAAGTPTQASAALERALRIEPRNYFVWSALAGAYLDSRNYEQAESIAKKSNSLARGNVYVEQVNWRVIHDVRVALGDADGAQLAQARVDAIQQMLTPPSETASAPLDAASAPLVSP